MKYKNKILNASLLSNIHNLHRCNQCKVILLLKVQFLKNKTNNSILNNVRKSGFYDLFFRRYKFRGQLTWLRSAFQVHQPT